MIEKNTMLIRQKDAAKRLGVTPQTLRNWQKKRGLRPTRIGNVSGYTPDELNRLIASNTKAD